MSCSNSTPFSFNTQYFYNNDCFSCGDNDCGANVQNSRCVIYTGANLSCSGVLTNDSLETALQKIDTQICSAIGDYSNYQFNCLTAYWGSSITQESTFVDAITSYVCTLRNDYDGFIGATFPDYQTAVDARFDAIEVPEITCATAGVTDTNTLQEVLSKYCTKFDDIDTALDISSVVWNNCFTVPSTPTTIAAGFTAVLSQICQISGGSTSLPVFNNIGTCLPSPGSSDTLVSTIDKIKTRLCQTPTLDNTELTSVCLSIPTDETDLQTLLQSIIDKIDTFTQNAPSYSEDFTLSPNGDPCDGITVALATPSVQDRFVASNSIDASPGTLADKVQAGTGITLDFIGTPGKMIISSDSASDFTVKASSGDADPDFLDEKLEGGTSSGITISTAYNGGTEKVSITPSIDMTTLVGNILTFISGNSTAQSQLCAVVAPCIGANCYTYSVENSTGNSVTVSYSDCASGLQTSVSLANGGTVSICARFGTVSAPGCTITAIAACTPGGGSGGGGGGTKNVFVINQTGTYISMDFDAGSQAFGPGMNGYIALTPGGFLKNTSGTNVYSFLTSLPSSADGDESPNPDTLGAGQSHTLNSDLSNLGYIIVTAAS